MTNAWDHNTEGSSAAKAVTPPSSVGGFAMPFDPLRLIAAVLMRWKIIFFIGLGCAGLAGLAGWLQFEPLFTASAQLMRQESSGSFRASEIGESFKPRQLSVSTLVSYMKSPAVLARVSEPTQPRLSPRAILSGLTITPERNTDLISVSFKSTRSEQSAIRVLNLFGTEVVRLTREMQGQEAAEVNRLLKQQISKTDDEMREINRELLTFAKETGLVSADKEMDAALRQLGELDLKYETMRIDHDTLDLRIQALEKQLTDNNPLIERIQTAREKLAELRAQYTDANPLVDEQMDRVSELEKQVAGDVNKPVTPPRREGNSLAASFYQEWLTLKTQKEVLAAQMEKIKVVRETVDTKLRTLPEKGLQYARIKARQQSLEAAQSLLASRQREAQAYEENPPGYYRFFEARPEQVEVSGRAKKLMLVTAAGGILGVLLSLALVCLVESFDDRVKTAADLKRSTSLPLLASLADLVTLDAGAQTSWAFRTWMALQTKLKEDANHSMVCGVIASSSGEGCSTWVDLLSHAASQRENTVIAITNRAPVSGTTVALEEAINNPTAVSPKPGTVTWLITPSEWRWTADRRHQWRSALAQWQVSPGLVLLMELSHVDQPETLLMAECMPQIIWLTGNGQARKRQLTERLGVLQNAHCRLAGAVLNRETKLLPSFRGAQ